MCHKENEDLTSISSKYSDHNSYQPQLIPLHRFVVKITNEADPDDDEAVRKAVRRYHNKLANGSIPRDIFCKIGKELFVNLDKFRRWIAINSARDRSSRDG